MYIETISIAPRFRGPPNFGNGGYVCGLIAKPLSGTVAVRLKSPLPLDTEVRLESTADSARLLHGNTIVGEARLAELSLELKPAPTYEQAQVSTRSYAGFATHRFPGCFVCGPERHHGDGLRIFPGPVAATDVIACPWVPDVSQALATTLPQSSCGRLLTARAALPCSHFPMEPRSCWANCVLPLLGISELASQVW